MAMHNDAASLWLRAVATDPRYADCLALEVCSHWIVNGEQYPSELFWCVDRDGDAYTLDAVELYGTGDERGYTHRYDAQVVVDHGQVQPCTDTIARYLCKVCADRLLS